MRQNFVKFLSIESFLIVFFLFVVIIITDTLNFFPYFFMWTVYHCQKMHLLISYLTDFFKIQEILTQCDTVKK